MRLRLVTLALSLSLAASAQSFTSVRELKNLSPDAISRLHTLETLNALPGGDWRFHAGDIPHGESPTLDDSSWFLVPAPTDRKSYSKAPKEAVWYRRLIEVPKTLNGYDITGSRILFQLQADANGPMPEIIYFNGKRVALGDDLEPIVLFEPARPGDKILVAVKLLHTVDDKTFTGVSLRIEPPTNPGAPSSPTASSSARVGFQNPLDPALRPNPNDLRIECITAANLLPTLPTPRRDLLPIVESAIAAIDLKALAAGNQSAFDASLRTAEFILSPLRGVLQQDKIDLAGNSHIDAAWLWPRSETIDVVHRTFTTALQLMDEYPNYTFTQSAAQYTEWMADKYPDLNAQIKQRVKEGRWEIVGGMWVEPDLNIPDGESLVRQLLVGQRFFQQQYGVTARIGWNPDSFGYNWQLPQIYKRSGMDFFVTQKMHWNDTNTLPFRLFWWESPDGSKVLTYFPTDYAWTSVNPTRLSADMAESQQRNPGLTEHLDLFGVGDHGGGPTRDMLDQADHWIAKSQANDAAKSQANDAAKSQANDAAKSQPSIEGVLPNGANIKKGVILSGAKDLCISGPATTSAPCASAPAAVPIIRYSTAQHFFDNIQPHLNPTSPTWNYDTIAKGYTPPPTAPAATEIATSSGNAAQSDTSASPGLEGAFRPLSPATREGALAPGTSSPLIGIPTWKDELYFEYHRGIFTSQAAHKRNIRTSETATLNAEKLASFAWLQGSPYPAETLTDNWKKITFNQFHDLAAGSGIAVIYRDAQKDFTEVFHAAKEITDASLNAIDANIDTTVKVGVPILVMNTLQSSRNEAVELHVQLPEGANDLQIVDSYAGAREHDLKNSELSYQVISKDAATHEFTVLTRVLNVPPMGYDVLEVHPIKRHDAIPSDLSSSENIASIAVKNLWLKLVVDKKTGCMTSLIALRLGFETVAPNACGNQLQTYVDKPKNYDAWNIDPGTLDGKMTPIDTVDSIKIVADGPVRKTIEIKRTFNKSHITQDVSLDSASDVVRVDTTVDWHETHTLLKVAFPLAATSAKATYEIPYGSIQRPTTRNNSWEKAQFEVPALRWADLGGKIGDTEQGVSILNDSKYGYDAVGNTLRLTLLRSPTWPDADADQGLQHFTYEIYPHTGPWQTAQTVHRAYELNTPLTASQVFSHPGSLPRTHSFASIDEPNIILTAIKKAEDANALIFRFYEATGKQANTHLHVPPGALYAIETNLMETPIPNTPHLPLTNDTITLPTNPFEIRTIEVIYPDKVASTKP